MGLFKVCFMRHFSKHIDNNLERHPLWREKEWLHKSHSGAEAGKEIGRIAGAVSIWDVFSIFVFAFFVFVFVQKLEKKWSGKHLQVQYGTFSRKHCQFPLYWLHFCFYPPQNMK